MTSNPTIQRQATLIFFVCVSLSLFFSLFTSLFGKDGM